MRASLPYALALLGSLLAACGEGRIIVEGSDDEIRTYVSLPLVAGRVSLSDTCPSLSNPGRVDQILTFEAPIHCHSLERESCSRAEPISLFLGEQADEHFQYDGEVLVISLFDIADVEGNVWTFGRPSDECEAADEVLAKFYRTELNPSTVHLAEGEFCTFLPVRADGPACWPEAQFEAVFADLTGHSL